MPDRTGRNFIPGDGFLLQSITRYGPVSKMPLRDDSFLQMAAADGFRREMGEIDDAVPQMPFLYRARLQMVSPNRVLCQLMASDRLEGNFASRYGTVLDRPAVNGAFAQMLRSDASVLELLRSDGILGQMARYDGIRRDMPLLNAFS